MLLNYYRRQAVAQYAQTCKTKQEDNKMKKLVALAMSLTMAFSLVACGNSDASANAGTMMGGSISADPLLNWFSGRTKMLKKNLAVEKKEMYLKQLENMFTNDFYVSKLKIPLEYVKGFEYYAVENESFVKILKSNNIATTTFLIGELAIKYKEIIAGEN